MCSPHCITISIGLPDRGKVTSMWCLSEERARGLLADLTVILGEAEHEFIASAECIDAATREAFDRAGGVLQVNRDA